MKNVFNFFSFIFHPFLIPVYFVLIILYKPIYPIQFYQLNHKILLLGLTFIHSFILPLAILLFLYYNSKIESLKLKTAKSRVYPYYLTFIAFFSSAVLYYFNKNIPDIFSLVFAIASVNILTLIIFLKKIKLSAHMVGITSLLVCLIYFDVVLLLADFIAEILLLVIILGITASSRLGLKAHTTKEIYYGILAALLSSILILFLISNWIFN